jgi:hypothetical protein
VTAVSQSAMRRLDLTTPEQQAGFGKLHVSMTGFWETAFRFVRCTCGWRIVGLANLSRGPELKEAYRQFDEHRRKPS